MEPKEIYQTPEIDLIKLEANVDMVPSGNDPLEGETMVFGQP